MYCLRIIDKW